MADIGIVESLSTSEAGTFITSVATNNATSFEVARIAIKPGELGFFMFYYNAVSGAATPMGANRIKIIRFKKTTGGVTSLIGLQSLYTNNDTGWNTVDFTVTANNGEIVISVVGLAGTEIRHTIKGYKTSGTLNDSFTF